MRRTRTLTLLVFGLALTWGNAGCTDPGDNDTAGDDDLTDDDAADDDVGDDDDAGGAPAIERLEEEWGPVGAPVRIHGSGFGASQGAGTVEINGVAAADVLLWTSVQVAVLVPPGATGGDLVLATGQGSDAASFAVTAGTAYHVAPDGDDEDPGTIEEPFLTIQQGFDVAQAGDWVLARDGTYTDGFATQWDGGGELDRIVLAGYPGEAAICDVDGRVLTVDHDWITVKDLELDSNFGGTDAIRTNDASHLVLRRLDVHDAGSPSLSGGGDCIDVEGGQQILIEDCQIHDCLAGDWDNQQDSHGVVLGNFSDATIRGCTIYRCSGDAIQADPDYDDWDGLLIDACHLYTDPLPDDKAAWSAGQIPGENAFDSKADGDSADHGFTIRDSIIHGFHSGWIGNQAALNIKKDVHGVVERCTIYDNVLAFRLREPAQPVVVRNCVVYGNDYAMRYEDGIHDLKLYNNTFIDSGSHFQDGGGGGLGSGFEVRNCLFDNAVPGEASVDPSNLAVASGDFATTFEDATAADYHLLSTAPAVDAGVDLAGLVPDDRDGVDRPQGTAYDVGAYERP